MVIFLLCFLKKLHFKLHKKTAESCMHTRGSGGEGGGHDSWCPQLEIGHKNSRRIYLSKKWVFSGGKGQSNIPVWDRILRCTTLLVVHLKS